ncbi:MAG TPA: molybdopterin-synthase adenylyltransferase MoeB [bacterium]|nr:molybdopterin-synthase adenylyltransferase MoeB [bacterium]HMW32113.1 molybdopterin-synthase adenylyltransferase MoeB [bacterium]HMW36306.1 molybdopterin-synthase adenylyltransferase MoeB [bacterium]HMZ05804.1 molybdopterin-synthase adenylyltransferase MoeB [bacterium]HNB08554.1 molybdopterin-synthase adenylyltransferase MoeB [bacterium]
MYGLTTEELARYNRHLILKEFGLEGQQKLKSAKVLVIGAGGLGAPCLLYLTAAGVGTIGIVDFDTVDASNLQRQVLYTVDDVGKPKADTAAHRLKQLNPSVHFNTHREKLTSANALDIIRSYDIIADGSDNFQTRYLVNDACVLLNKPLIYASIFQFEGQVSVFNYTDPSGTLGPNYRDLFPTPPPPGMVPSCAEGGVLGVLPGIIGSMQASEAIKVITGIGTPLSGKLFLWNALTFESRTMKFKRDPANPINGLQQTITALIDYEVFCGISEPEKQTGGEISPAELKHWIDTGKDFQLIDVRESFEYGICNLGGTLIPLAQIMQESARIAQNKPVVVHCKMGGRSAKAIAQLRTLGFDNLINLRGGIIAYAETVDPSLAKY